ncbi:MAG: TolB family protein [Anaerolineales bacterium]
MHNSQIQRNPALSIVHCALCIALSACASDLTSLPLSTTAPIANLAPTLPGPTPFPSLTPPPLNNRTPEPTPTPTPALRQLTASGCCVQPFFSPDGSQVWFIDKPSAAQPGGVWGVSVAAGLAGGEPQLITERIGALSHDGSLMTFPEAGQTIVERVATRERWSVPAAGRAIAFSPDATQIAWQVASSTENFDRRLVEIWVANVDGANARAVANIIGGGLGGWFPDSARLLITSRDSADSEPYLAALNVTDGARTIIATGLNIRGVVISTNGNWVAYTISFSGDAARDGLWVARADGSEGKRLPLFGAYRWRTDDRLLVIPLEATTGSHRLVEVFASDGAITRTLTDPRQRPFRIAGGDWALSPDGNRIAFVNAADRNLWLLELPPPIP